MTRSTLFLVVAVVLGFWVFLKVHDSRLVERAKLDASRDSLTHAVARLDSLSHSDSVSRMAVVRLSDSLAHHRQQDQATVARLAHRTDTVVVTVRERLPDSVKAGFDSVVAGKDSIIGAQAHQITSLSAEVDLWRVQASRSDSLAQSWKRAFSEAAGERDRYRNQASPGLVARAVSALPFMAAAFVLAKVTH